MGNWIIINYQEGLWHNMYKKSVSKLRFNSYLVKDINFVLNENYESYEDLELDLQFNHEIQLDYEGKKAIIILECTVFENYIENNFPFKLEVGLVGFFEFDTDLSEKETEVILETNGTAILFPYLRTLISTITTNACIPPLIIPTMNISKMIKFHEE